MILLVDGDIVVYRSCYSAQSKDGDVEWLYDYIDNFIADLEHMLGSTKTIITLSCPREENFRVRIDPTYKANRKEEKPKFFEEAKQYLLDQYEVAMIPKYEADDIMGVLHTTFNRCGVNSIICSIDKDMLTIPGKHYNWNKPEQGIIKINKEQASRNFWLQMLTGDTADNIKGINGIGPKRAEKILNRGDPLGIGAYEDEVYEEYHKHQREKDFVINYKLLTIKTH